MSKGTVAALVIGGLVLVGGGVAFAATRKKPVGLRDAAERAGRAEAGGAPDPAPPSFLPPVVSQVLGADGAQAAAVVGGAIAAEGGRALKEIAADTGATVKAAKPALSLVAKNVITGGLYSNVKVAKTVVTGVASGAKKVGSGTKKLLKKIF